MTTNHGNKKSCFVDTDGDGLPNCAETDTGVFIGAWNTGTDPNAADTDEDGLPDGDEVNGTLGGLNLPALGVSPLHKDILLEYDWMDDAECGTAHSHRPTDAMLAIVREAFANAPVGNPDRKNGIRVYQDVARLHSDVAWGYAGLESGSNLIEDADGFIEGGVDDINYIDEENTNFNANRRGYFHYVVFAHGYTASPGSSGQASILGHRMLITLACGYADIRPVAYTIMHELGHNLGLLHGGDEACNRKPNYNSVMNYRFQFTGVMDCSLHPLGKADYSSGIRRMLDENALIEGDGVCRVQAAAQAGIPPIDWNHNNLIDPDPISYDVNFYPNSICPGLAELHDYNDWAHVRLTDVRAFAAVASDPCAAVPE
jgi:hypothetical protein